MKGGESIKVLGERFYQMSNVIFQYKLTPIQFAVYNYLICCTGQKEKCWPAIKTIADRCNCSENSVRSAIKVLDERGFIRKVETFRMGSSGKSRQTNNTYFVLPLPDIPNAN